MLALDEVERAGRFLERLADARHVSRTVLGDGFTHPTLAGLLLAETAIAAMRGIALDVHAGAPAAELPPALGDFQLVTIVGNLLDNAFHAVAEMPPERRRVVVRIGVDAASATIEVRDWGSGIGPSDAAILERGVTTKRDHAGIGLALVREAAAAAGGWVDVRSHEQGTSFAVVLPRD
jgi:sensor histidine kinase regulating citrate/malate metabolism